MEAARIVRLPGLPEVKVVNGNSARIIDATRVTRSSMKHLSTAQQMPAPHQVPTFNGAVHQVASQTSEKLQPHRQYKPPVVAARSPAPCARVDCTAASSSSSCSEIVSHVKRLGDQLEEISKQLERFNETLWLMHNNNNNNNNNHKAPSPPPPAPPQTNNIAHHEHQPHRLSHNCRHSPDHLSSYPIAQSNHLHCPHQAAPANSHSPTRQPLTTHQQTTRTRASQPTTTRSPQPPIQPVTRHFSPAHKYHLKTPQSLENIPSPRKHTTTTTREPFSLPLHRTTTSFPQRHNNNNHRHSAPIQQQAEETLADVSMASKEYLIRNKLQCPQTANHLDYY